MLRHFLFFFLDLAFSGAFVTESAGSEVLGIQKNIKSGNQIGNIVQEVFDDVFAIESPKKVNLLSLDNLKMAMQCICTMLDIYFLVIFRGLNKHFKTTKTSYFFTSGLQTRSRNKEKI